MQVLRNDDLAPTVCTLRVFFACTPKNVILEEYQNQTTEVCIVLCTEVT